MTRHLSFLLLGALACAHYTTRPLAPGAGVVAYNARRLDDRDPATVLDSLLPPTDSTIWDSRRLAEAAWLLRATRPRAEAEVVAARAAVRTAGGRPQPGLDATSEFSFSGRDGSSDWAFGLSALYPLETGGRRGARIARADAGVLVAEASRDRARWDVRMEVRVAAVELSLALADRDALGPEQALLDSAIALAQARYREGTLSALEAGRFARERGALLVELSNAERLVAERRAALAVAVGVPPSALDGVPLALRPSAACEAAAGTPRDGLQRQALTRREELHLTLAEYQVAEGEVRVEVSQSWPTVELGPGVLFDHGVGKWTFGFGLPTLPLDGHRAAIAEAEARRVVAGLRAAEQQEAILTELDAALTGCASAGTGLAAVDSLVAVDAAAVARADAAYRRGESGRLAPVLARLALATTRRQRVGLQATVVRAGLALERALGTWTEQAADAMEGR